MARIVSIYLDKRDPFVPADMSLIRWLRMSEALARRGHHVDIATGESELKQGPVAMAPRLRRVSLDHVRWNDYDAVKTLFHKGFETLERRGGLAHPLLISNLGSVAGPADMPGVYFYGEKRARLYSIQKRMAERGATVSLLTPQSTELWRRCFGTANPLLLVPGATDAEPPAPGPDPYPRDGLGRCIYSGNIYNPESQPEAHRTLLGKLNGLGRLLAHRRIRLFVAGSGDAAGLHPDWVTHLGAVPHEQSWDHLWHAGAGLVLAFGEAMNHNESTKIYYYLRAGLPVVCEAHYPNERLVTEARLGVIAPNGDLEAVASAIEECITKRWDKRHALSLMAREHTWDQRAAIYDRFLRAKLARVRDGSRGSHDTSTSA